MKEPTNAVAGESRQTVPADDALAASEREAREYLEGWKRAKADLVNFKREEVERIARVAAFAAADLVRDLLAVLDSCDLGMASHAPDTPAWRGLSTIRSQLTSVLERRGLARFETLPGTAFDPARHEAVGEAAGAGPPGTVAREAAAGYLFRGEVLRPARVLVVQGEHAEQVETGA